MLQRNIATFNNQQLKVIQASNGGYNKMLWLQCNNMTNTNNYATHAQICIGKDPGSNYNAAEIEYNHYSDGSTSNALRFGFVGVSGIMSMFANRSVEFTDSVIHVNTTTGDNPLRINRTNMTQGQTVYAYVGKRNNQHERFCLGYSHSTDDNTDNNNHGWLYLNGMLANFYEKNIRINRRLNVNTSTVGGFNDIFDVTVSDLTTGQRTQSYIGKNTNTNNAGLIQYSHVGGDGSYSNTLGLGIAGIGQILTINGSGVIETPMNNTQSELGTNFRKAIFDLIYPVGSVYITIVQLPGTKYLGPNGECFINWEGCVWRTFHTDKFLRQSSVISDGQTWWFDNYLTVSGEAEHTLTINEMPPHSHPQYVSANTGSAAVRRDYSSDGGSSIYEQGCNTGTVGGNGLGYAAPHNNIPPCLTVFMYQRYS